VLLAACLAAVQAQAADYPNKPIHVIVPFDAGGSVDAVARLLAEKMRDDLGQPMVIDNKGGAGGMLAFEEVVHAKPDGYTILLGASSYVITAALRDLPYDPVKDITPITLVNSGPLVITVNATLPVKNLQELVDLLKSKPGALNYGSPGVGSGAQLAGLLFQQATGTSMVHVPFKSDALVLTSLLGGDVQVAFASGPALRPLVEAGQLRTLAVTSDKPWPTMPDLPTANQVAPGFSQIAWHGVWGPAKMPKEIVDRLNKAYARALALPEVQARLRADGREPTPSTPEAFGQTIAQGLAQYKAVAKASNIHLD
jgi:tripartite-type tricarboxylate transporter receptor subunit TctC